MSEIELPPEARRIEEFQFVKVLINGEWRPALLVAWIRAPDGWACQLRTPSYKAARGRITDVTTVPYDPARIQRLTVDDLNEKHRPA